MNEKDESSKVNCAIISWKVFFLFPEKEKQ